MSSSKSLIPNLANARLKQYAWLALGVVLVFIALWIYMSDEPSAAGTIAKDNRNTTTSTMMAAGQQVSAVDSWVGKAGQEIVELKAENAKLLEAGKDSTARILKLEEFSASAAKAGLGIGALPVYPPGTPVSAGVGVGTGAGVALPQPINAQPRQLPAGSTTPLSGGAVSNGTDVFGAVGRVFSAPAEPTIGRISLRARPADTNSGATDGSTVRQSSGVPVAPVAAVTTATTIKHAGSSYLPIGFAKVRILGGLDAPTNGQAQNEPLPLILEIIDSAILPNQFRANTKQCLLIGQAWGDISSERAYGRIETLSCIRHDGSVLEVAAKGSVYGEDGKYGIRGRLVSKQGQILANALFAGVISGIGQGIQFRSTSNTVTPLGSTISTPNANQGFEAGFGGGLGKALDRLAGYYVSLAEKTFPVIEIDAGRIVDVAFTKGITLDVPLPEEYPMAASRSRVSTVRGGASDLN